jgi:hypothetical protein
VNPQVIQAIRDWLNISSDSKNNYILVALMLTHGKDLCDQFDALKSENDKLRSAVKAATLVRAVVDAHFDGDDGELTRCQSAKIALESIRDLLKSGGKP